MSAEPVTHGSGGRALRGVAPGPRPHGARPGAAPETATSGARLLLSGLGIDLTSESLQRTPAAAWVLTREEILRSGATTIPEILRLVPGVQVSRADTNSWAVGVRGFATVEHEPWHARLVLWFLYIQPAWRRRGLGRGLLERVEAHGRRVGASHVWLETSNVNVPGVALACAEAIPSPSALVAATT